MLSFRTLREVVLYMPPVVELGDLIKLLTEIEGDMGGAAIS